MASNSALPQKGHTRPGEVLFGTDSHTCTAGAFNEFATGIGNTDAGFVMGTGKLLLKVPETMHFRLEGQLQPGVMAKDVILQVIGEIGFVLPSLAFACVTEEEIFGTQKARRQQQRKKQKDKLKTFVQELRELSVGDYVVHADHGVGVYRGLTLSELPVSRMEALQGMKPRRVEALVVEYAGGDRLFLPVTRLNQIDKDASKEGHSPKLDKLGGQTFGRTKSRVKWLEPDISLAQNLGLSAQQVREAQWLVERHADEIRSAWWKHIGG